MKKHCAFLILFFSVNINSHAGGLEEYMATINNQCPGINQLIIKKSLIEITQVQNCSAAFTSLLLRECTKLNCNELINYWLSFNGSKSGTVIGK